MTCSNCQHQNPTVAKFCMECGTKLEHKCAKCQTIYPEGAKFCMECGNSLQVAVGSSQYEVVENDRSGGSNPVTPKPPERRQLTCLFCDLVGSTALSEKLDAEEYRQVILDYQHNNLKYEY